MTSLAAPAGPTASDAAHRRVVLAYVAMAGVVVIWGMGPPLSKLISGPPTTVAAVRIWLAVPLTYLVLRSQGGRVTKAAMRGSLWGGVFFGANLLLFFSALRHTTVATITLIGVLQPVTVGLVSVKLFGERITRWGLGWTLVAIAGVGGAVLAAGKTVRTTPLGLLLSVATILCLSAYMLASRQARTTLAPNEYLFGVMVWASMVLAVPVVFEGLQWRALDGHDWLWLAVVLIGPGWLGHLLLSWAITEIPMSISSLNMLPATVLSIAAAWPIHDEHVTLLQGLFGLVTLVAVALVVRGRGLGRRPDRPDPVAIPVPTPLTNP